MVKLAFVVENEDGVQIIAADDLRLGPLSGGAWGALALHGRLALEVVNLKAQIDALAAHLGGGAPGAVSAATIGGGITGGDAAAQVMGRKAES